MGHDSCCSGKFRVCALGQKPAFSTPDTQISSRRIQDGGVYSRVYETVTNFMMFNESCKSSRSALAKPEDRVPLLPEIVDRHPER